MTGDGLGGILLGFGILFLAIGLIWSHGAIIYGIASQQRYVGVEAVVFSYLIEDIGLVLTIWGLASSHHGSRRIEA
jgi:uncharacterized membrane protein YqjE